MRGDRGLRSRIEVWLYRKIRPLPGPPGETGGLARYKRLAAGAVLVVAAATGGAVVGYERGYEEAGEASAPRESAKSAREHLPPPVPAAEPAPVPAPKPAPTNKEAS